MILDTLVNQLNQRLQYEKRAQVCLWFDERRGFARTLDASTENGGQTTISGKSS